MIKNTNELYRCPECNMDFSKDFILGTIHDEVAEIRCTNCGYMWIEIRSYGLDNLKYWVTGGNFIPYAYDKTHEYYVNGFLGNNNS